MTERSKLHHRPLADFGALEIFVAVVECHSITRAAERLGIAPSTVSKKLSEIEAVAKTRLLNRTTRKMTVTDAGQRYYARCLRIVEELDDADAELFQEHYAPEGTLVITAPVVLGVNQIAPRLRTFMERYPGLSVKLDLSSKNVDLPVSGFDLAVRITREADLGRGETVLARNRRVFCASRAYLERHGHPRHPSELSEHNCLVAIGTELFDTWRFIEEGQVKTVKVTGNLTSDHAEVLVQAAKDGIGIAQLGMFAVAPALAEGSLVDVFPEHHIADTVIIAATPHASYIPRRAAIFIDYLAESFGNPPQWDAAQQRSGY